MKKTFKTMLALMAGAMVFTACNKDDIYENIDEQNPSELKSMTFTASMEGQEGATRATIDGLDIKWTTGDKISIFDGAEENNGNQEFTLATGERAQPPLHSPALLLRQIHTMHSIHTRSHQSNIEYRLRKKPWLQETV